MEHKKKVIIKLGLFYCNSGSCSVVRRTVGEQFDVKGNCGAATWPMISQGDKHHFNENCSLLDYYVVSSGNFIPTFRDNLSGPFSVLKHPKSTYH